MPETYPIKEQIVQAVQTALAAISKAGGYNTDVEAATRPRRTGEGPGPQAAQVRIVQEDEQRDPENDLAGNPPIIGWRLPLSVDLIVRVSEQSTQPMDQALNLFEADVRQVLMADVTWGGLAIDTELGGSLYPPGGEGVEGVTVTCDVLYRTPENDPYTAA